MTDQQQGCQGHHVVRIEPQHVKRVLEGIPYPSRPHAPISLDEPGTSGPEGRRQLPDVAMEADQTGPLLMFHASAVLHEMEGIMTEIGAIRPHPVFARGEVAITTIHGTPGQQFPRQPVVPLGTVGQQDRRVEGPGGRATAIVGGCTHGLVGLCNHDQRSIFLRPLVSAVEGKI